MNTPAFDILLVEDSQSDVDLFLLAHEMNKSMATVRVARDGVEAMAFSSAARTDPRMLFTTCPGWCCST